jgi:hypothetical protein
MEKGFSVTEKVMSKAEEIMSGPDRTFSVAPKVMCGADKTVSVAGKVFDGPATRLGVAQKVIGAAAEAEGTIGERAGERGRPAKSKHPLPSPPPASGGEGVCR